VVIRSKIRYLSDERVVLKRMQYWTPGLPPKAPTDRYLVFSKDIGGWNNIRIALENVGLMAVYTNRTLVLPPASPMYLLDFGARISTAKSLPTSGTLTAFEDMMNIGALKASFPTLTWAEFTHRTGLSWEDAIGRAGRVDMKDMACKNLPPYRDIHQPILYMQGDEPRREGFACSEWAIKRGSNYSVKFQVGKPGWALLTHAFPYHQDAFDIAVKVVSSLGMFEYAALHARYNDFAYGPGRQPPESLLLKWDPLFSSHAKKLYIATDEPWRFTNITGTRVKPVFWHDLVLPSTGILHALKAQYTPERWFKLQGPVEELICTFANVFVGSDMSSFSGHIQRMRIYAKAPSTMRLVHTQDKVPSEQVKSELTEWYGRGGQNAFVRKAPDDGDEFLQLDVDNHGYL
jgi:hypothetical protein